MQFDIKKAAAVLGSGPGITSTPVDAIGMAFGIPRCLVGLSKDVMRALPSSVIQDVSKSLQEGRDFATDRTKDIVKKIFLNTGIIEFDTETGLLRLVAADSSYGLDSDYQQGLEGLNAIVSAAQAGATMWRNIENIGDQVQNIVGCIGKLKDANRFASTNSSLLRSGVDYDSSAIQSVEEQYELEIAQVKSASNFIASANSTLRLASEVLRERIINPALEPVFVEDPIFSGTTFSQTPDGQPDEESETIFDLVYGPPRSKKGTFILSVDGLYYDTGREDVYDISAIVPSDRIPLAGDRWKFEQDPNLGGKGDAVSIKSLNRFFSTIFDENIIDDSEDLAPFYENDHFLQTLISQKDKHIYDLSSEISKLEALDGSGDAMVINLKNSLASQTARHFEKINKRKKQIEIAIKAPSYYGEGAVFNTSSDIPINDFSYLSSVRLPLALEKQKKLVFRQGEVSSIVLPIRPTFVTSESRGEAVNMDHLVVPNIGKGSIIRSASSYDSSNATVLSLTDNITTDKLSIIYNFLEPEVLSNPGSDTYQVLNCATFTLSGNGQMIGKSSPQTFPSGLSIPYFEGIGDFSTVNYISSVGSYVKLPDISPLRNLLYTADGCTFDFWVHMPDLSDSAWTNNGVSSLHRLVLACENNGGGITYDEPNRMPPFFGSNVVRGMTMGFTRDRQITLGLDPSDEEGDNLTSSSLGFYLAPTQSVNVSDVTFINNQSIDNECPSTEGWHSLFVPASSVVNGKSFLDSSASFMHVSVAISPKNNKVDLYLDSNLMATSSMHDVFGVNPYTTPAIPSFHADSFNYSVSTMGESSPLANGPSLNNFFTPWILGGGYTDGNIDDGGFMGSNSGLRSGLDGHLGSFKIYTKALNSIEVLKNYNAQKDFFKNIVI